VETPGALYAGIAGRQAERYFDGLELVAPGFVRCALWRPAAAQGRPGPDVPTLAGVARKP
jgi:S-adenosyl methyltransferase